ncbi:MFS transporter [uncultured Mucilaginibacter sp.]|uniref:MFS transporter n=1 Tax=uncultured Mucilaginibacter sp. TaxID=797541 RepID=UPI0025DC9E06|nr:MFS transporter [uncultured Mucilaginibacter sp.]
MNDKNNSPVITLSLVSLTMGGLSIGMTEFLMMGVLPDISHSLQVSIPQAGYLISIYALGVVIGAPLMAAIAGNHKPKQMLIALMLMVFVFNGMFAVAPGYGWLLAARFLAGLPHGAFFGIGAVVATKLAKPGREARSVALMFAGLTVANIIGVPLGTFISHNFSWRFSFGLVALFALMAIVSIRFWMPDVRMEKQGSFAASLGIFKKIDLWLVIAISAIGTGGFFSWISYIAPVVIHVSGFSSSLVALVMVIIGLGMAAGNFLGGRMADRFAPLKAIAILLLLMIVVLLGFVALIHFKLPTIFMAFVVGDVGFEVTLLGSVPLPKLGDLYRSCAIGFALSGTNLSYLPVELMACGIPVVSNSGPQVEWYCEDGVNSLVVPPFPTHIADAISRLISDPSLRADLIQGGIQSSLRSSWDSEASKIENFIESQL